MLEPHSAASRRRSRIADRRPPERSRTPTASPDDTLPDLYRVPALFVPEGYGAAAAAVLLAGAVSGWLVKRDVDRLDLVATLKARE